MDISNQSNKEGIRIVLELKKDADIEKIRNILYKKTAEDTFGVNMLAIAHGRPETLNLREEFWKIIWNSSTRIPPTNTRLCWKKN